MKSNISRALGFLLLLAISGAATSASENDATKQDLKQFEGTWQIVSLEINGNKAAAEDVKKIVIVNEPDGVMAIEVDGKIVERGLLKIYPTQKPKTVDLTATEGDSKGKTMLGIYEFDGDTRKVCYGEPGKERPTDFSTAEGSGRYLVLLKRVKK
ncbi:MAG: hypothetical protein JWM11_1575 [Planctomycetaceae bacterium]|nr:hypothetical protein [Planctomycetaceae bacterium]